MRDPGKEVGVQHPPPVKFNFQNLRHTISGILVKYFGTHRLIPFQNEKKQTNKQTNKQKLPLLQAKNIDGFLRDICSSCVIFVALT